MAARRNIQLPVDESENLKIQGDGYLANGQFNEAVTCYRQAIARNRFNVEAHFNLGNALKELGHINEAVASYRQSLALKPDFAEAHYKLGNAMDALGQLDDAVACFRRAVEIKPDYTYAHSNLGSALKALGQFDETVKCFRRSLEIAPDLAPLHFNLGIALYELGQLGEAEESFLRALELQPDYADAHYNLGLVLKDLGNQEAALERFHLALSFKPMFPEAHGNLLFIHAYHGWLNPDEYLSIARGWDQTCLSAQERQLAHERAFIRQPLAGRRLKVGYVSGDYRKHAVSYFIEQIFAHHDQSRIELFCYSTNAHRDEVTERIQLLASHWVPVIGVSDVGIRERIEADGIDVLIDLSGHTGLNRLGVFARRAAPVQAHYLGYFASTGLSEMDYWIGDDIVTPIEMEHQFSERIWRLPRVWVSYKTVLDAPEPDWRPADDGSIWIGSFNNLGKLTPATLALWGRVLAALPEGKLLLKSKELADAGNRQRILNILSGHGVSPERIDLQPGSKLGGLYAQYNRLDIALDPVGGHGGGTTTCDTLWMGVPVIMLQGTAPHRGLPHRC
ncbi:MAG: tetratricopeptide repeat protein [Nitrosomonadales bacterium]